ncbi:GNAT family N-acetyltransferase [Streptomyces sp. 6N223]|uniref:GNAT family N-acetyltransferase n=1 Tax=Streptomyces sp. 6N223 TaxID=3457412 RepID=UPI003FD5861A
MTTTPASSRASASASSRSASSRSALATLPIRRLTPADVPACLDLAADRGWPREERKWRLLLSAGQGFGIDADARGGHGGLIAAVVATSYAADDPRLAISSIGMMLVAARHERRGLGLRLLTHALAECGTPAAFLTATEAGRPLYERLGFTTVSTLSSLRGALAAPGAPGAAGGVHVRPATAADLPAVLAYDLPVFGADRTGLLTRLPSFADQFLVAQAEPAPGAPITGYAAAWPNPDSTVIGPLLAEDLPTAQALITRLAADAPAGVPLRFDADARHPELERWLRAAGLAGEPATTTLMVRGAPDLPGDLARRLAPYSVALG